MNKARRKYLTDQLAKAVTEHRKQPHKISDEAYVKRLAMRYTVNPKTLAIALQMLGQGNQKEGI